MVKVSPLQTQINPHILNDLHHFLDRMQTLFLVRDLKQYRPHRKPITEVPEKMAKIPSVMRKRKLIVRDWFFFVVWQLRLKKIVQQFIQKE